MGILRLYLALCVIASHSNRISFIPMHSGDQAVEIFFIISGFCMEMVYEKYRSAGAFYLSRAQRIFFPYWTILALVLGVSALLGLCVGNWGEITPYLDAGQRNGPGGVVFTAISNFTIFGQDAVYFLQAEPGHALGFTPEFHTNAHPLWYFLAIPQAWSVAVELVFYLMVPLLARLRSPWLLGLVVLSIGARVYVYEGLGWRDDPWTYRVMPLELTFFILGMLSCRLWRWQRPALERALAFISGGTTRQRLLRGLGVIGLCLALKVGAYLSAMGLGRNYSTLLFNFCWAALLPVLFTISRSDRIDREVGELSYPVYLVHFFIISLVMLAMGRPELTNFCFEVEGTDFPKATGTIVAVLSVLVAWGLNRTLFGRLERIRHATVRKVE